MQMKNDHVAEVAAYMENNNIAKQIVPLPDRIAQTVASVHNHLVREEQSAASSPIVEKNQTVATTKSKKASVVPNAVSISLCPPSAK